MSFFKKIYWNFLILFLFIPFLSVASADTVFATNNANSNDNTCLLHTDKSFYVTGEVIWYSLYLPADFAGTTVIIEAELINEAGQIVFQTFLNNDEKTRIGGYYKIPYDFATGMYLLQFSVQHRTKKEQLPLLKKWIPVYNDLQPIPQMVSQQAGKEEPASSMPATDLNIEIALPDNNFGYREKMTPRIQVTDAAGQPVAANLSVSIVDKKWANASGAVVKQAAAIDEVGALGNKIILQGNAVLENGAVYGNEILGVYSKEEDEFTFTRTAANGDFEFNVAPFQGQRLLQILPDQEVSTRVISRLKQSEDIDTPPDMPFSASVQAYVNLSRQRKKIYQRYGTSELQIEPEVPRSNKKVVKPDVSFLIKEYENFEFMSIFFKENLTPLRFDLVDSIYIAKMYNPKNQSTDKFFDGNPLMIIDGVATREGDFIARMRMEDIEKVDLIYDLKKLNKNYKIFGNSGITKITTYDKIKNIPVFEAQSAVFYNGIQPTATYPVFRPAALDNPAQPVFRPHLFWSSELQTDKSGATSFEVWQSDDRSTYLIQVVAQSADGKIGVQTVEYTVGN